ncbi:hypothetical protein CC85DRAFT_326397 [Cutaneotrichosporon oleaginosum]|uniref:Integral membrane protein n=1 Tax=Cutaneotrichosporon oleaginosum TaxID=879819 RepID=A0A0J0XTY2_9TREE|nr:uncharacterized protein CC85DRAFT_326397 [Cutaneotrichosporon oleaginosum]KLT44535.1 hypothetical protein CC85DRAFT_326397 [Cutaneotrichosporon oleaginosum]TXT13951.1 hypothetical protein COLE_00144 [Cutaneotrichosporon oleaginosum]
MSSDTGVSTLVAGMFLTGCANSLLTKYQDKLCVENCDGHGKRVDFEQPVYQTLNMFIGEFLCVIPLLWNWLATARKGRPSYLDRLFKRSPGYGTIPQEEEEEELEIDHIPMRGWAVCWMWFPAFFDICGTTLMNVGLILTPVSIYQMSRGALVLWVGVLSVIFLRRHLYLYQWTALLIVTLGVMLVGLAGTLIKRETMPSDPGATDIFNALIEVATSRADDDPAKVALGVSLILFAQIFTASQYVVEEKIMTHYTIDPLAAVSLEGMWGGLTTLGAMPILHKLFAKKNAYFDVPRGWRQITQNPPVMWASLMIALSIGAFNFFGLSVTSRVSATTRSTIDTCRTLGIWIVSLAIGWEMLVWPYSLLQVAGFAMLVYGTFVFNGLLEPIFFRPEGIRLPEEDGIPHIQEDR